jgi:hypothetical protein
VIRRGVLLLSCGAIGALLLAYHVAETRRAAGAAEMDERLRRARGRVRTVIGAARRFRDERDEARAGFNGAVDYVANIKAHGLTILRIADVDHLRSERDRAAAADAEACQLRVALELIADGCDVPQRIAVEALGRGEEESCSAN